METVNRHYIIPRVFANRPISSVPEARLMEIRFQAIAVVGTLIIIGLLLTLFFSGFFARPLKLLARTTRAIGEGDFSGRMPIASTDELGKLGEAVNEMASGLAEKERIKETFGRVVDERVRDHLLAGNLELGGELRTATVLFTDIRGFTTLLENMPPDRVVSLLNRYLDRMSNIIVAYHGLVNKYIGDAVNTASRLEQYTKECGHDIVISSTTLEEAGSSADSAAGLGIKARAIPLGNVPVRGKKQAVTVFTI